MKKILAVALVLCLVFALAPMAFADNPVGRILYMLREKYLLPTSTVPSMRQEQIFTSAIM